MAQEKTATLPKRSEIPPEHTWKLEDIYPNDELWEQDFARVRELLPRLESFRGRLGEGPDTLMACLDTQFEVAQIHERLFVYAHMRKDEDTTNTHYQALSERSESLGVRIGAAAAYIEPEILSLPDETLRAYLNSAELVPYRHYLEDMVRQKPHTLSAAEEQLLAEVGEVASAARNIFTMLNEADLKFPTIRDESGREVELTKGRYIQLMESRDRRVRQETFHALYGTYAKQRNTFAATLHASVKKDVFYARVRKYPSALAASLSADNVPISVYDNLIQTVRERLPDMHRYVRLRKRALGVDELHMYDLYTPIVSDVDIKVPWEEAVQTVERAMRPLGEAYGQALSQGMRSRWIDVFENQGKRSGAYSWGAYGSHPYVLMNYQDNVNNLFALAHEMGHAMHTYYSHATQPYVYAHYTIFVAEVASTLNESLLLHHLLKETSDERIRLYLLNHYLEEFRGTVYRQTMFAEFEKLIHEQVEAGEALTADSLCRTYRQLNLDYFGPDMVVDPEIDLEWARIPHFYRAFYVYKYATGFAAAAALAKQILDEGQPAVERYLRFLRSGSSDYSIALLQQAGVDMTSPQPVAQALDVFAEVLGEMESML